MALDGLWNDYDARGIPMACTLGRFHTDAAEHGLTIVPGRFHCSLDVRAYDESILAELDEKIDQIIAGIEQRRGVRFHRPTKASAAVGHVDAHIKAGLLRAASVQNLTVLQIGSPASHDGAAFAEAGVPIGMIFVRNENGSHNPREAMGIDDFLAGTIIMTQWVIDSMV
jgi:N-carbamoyl-L-amino-acid hydrolase